MLSNDQISASNSNTKRQETNYSFNSIIVSWVMTSIRQCLQLVIRVYFIHSYLPLTITMDLNLYSEAIFIKSIVNSFAIAQPYFQALIVFMVELSFRLPLEVIHSIGVQSFICFQLLL